MTTHFDLVILLLENDSKEMIRNVLNDWADIY